MELMLRAFCETEFTFSLISTHIFNSVGLKTASFKTITIDQSIKFFLFDITQQ